MVALALLLLASLLLATAVFVLALRIAARSRRSRFLPALGPVVRIATPCAVVRGRAAIPGTLGLTPAGLSWDAPLGASDSTSFDSIKRLETDDRLTSGRRFLRAQVLRVTLVSGETREFVLSRGAAWEWRRALGEWAGGAGIFRSTP